MRPFWAPQSALFLTDPPMPATPAVLRLLLARGRTGILYAGDRMAPTVRHGERFEAEPVGDRGLERADAVLAVVSGVPDLLRVAASGADRVSLAADSDPGGAVEVPRADVIARARVPARSPDPVYRQGRRLLLDILEAAGGRIGREEDPSRTVHAKYRDQARFYTSSPAVALSDRTRERIRARLPRPGRVLVAGCGTGRESLALAEEGWSVTGIDFVEPMIGIARAEAARRGLPARFVLSDLRHHQEEPASLRLVFFTYDVYSFLPSRPGRIDLLRRMRRWLEPGGAILLSARRLDRFYDLLVLTIERLARIGSRGVRWGDSHSRWIDAEGSLRRSFVHVFPARALEREIRASGFALEGWEAGHGVLTPLEELR